jgi:hypothetical protein
MYLRHTLFLFIFFISTTVEAYELVVIQAVSSTKRTFITRNGKRQGIIKGVTATFTSDNVSILARAVNVIGTHTQWEIINTEAHLPFEKGAIVTYSRSTEFLWTLSPESERKKIQ